MMLTTNIVSKLTASTTVKLITSIASRIPPSIVTKLPISITIRHIKRTIAWMTFLKALAAFSGLVFIGPPPLG